MYNKSQSKKYNNLNKENKYKALTYINAKN